MRTVTFQVLGIAQPKGSARAFKRGERVIVTTDNPRLRDWEHAVGGVAQTLNEAPFDGAVTLAVMFHFPRPKSKPRRVVHCITRPDLDKAIRAIGDALTGILFADDAQIVAVHACKVYAAAGTAPRAEITIAEAGALFGAAPVPTQPAFTEV